MAIHPLISCILPVYNCEQFIAAALDSVLAQSWRPIEIIVADDGSTDRTAEIVAGYGNEVQFVTEETAGPAATRNLGLAAATGDFVAFLDGDDLWHEDKLTRQMLRFETEPVPDACVTHVQHFWMPELADEEAKLRDHLRGQVVPGYVAATLLAPRALFDRVGGFDRSLWFGDGADWFMRAAEAGVVVALLDDVLLYHRMHKRNLTRRRADASREEFLDIVRASLNRRRAAGDSTTGTAPAGAGSPDKS
jgi:glycosyltransferase involved in cell wall biosynthesis